MPSCRRCLRGFPIHGLLRKATAGRRGRRPLQHGHPHLHFSRYPYIITTAQLSLRGSFRLSKKVCSPLGPLCEGAPPAGGGGENCTAVRNISGYGKVLSLRPFGAPPSQKEVFRHAAPSPDGEGFLFFIASPPARLRARRGAPRASKRRSASGCGQTAAGG